MITDRDVEIYKFINRYGKSYVEVLGKTFFNNVQVARNRINKLAKQGFISYWNTNLMKPRRALVLTEETKEFLTETFDLKIKSAKLNVSTINHNVMEQIVDFHIQKLGNVERTTVFTHQKILHHIPDLLLNHEQGKIFFEIELTKKSYKRYVEIFEKMKRDNVIQVVYVVKNETVLKSFSANFPKWEKLRFITIDTLVFNLKNGKKLGALSQEEIAKLI